MLVMMMGMVVVMVVKTVMKTCCIAERCVDCSIDVHSAYGEDDNSQHECARPFDLHLSKLQA